MSFEINGGPGKLPAIQKSHHTNDGGAGNLGYFQREKKKKDEEESGGEDVFESSSSKKDGEEEDDENKLTFEMNSIGTRIKNFWEAMGHKKEENPESDS